MKILALSATVVLTLVVILSSSRAPADVSAQGTKPPETMVLAKESKLGQVAFNHQKHFTENRSEDLSKPIACVECHHTAQPASEAVKNPPHKTAWPADRTTTLTLDLQEKDANAVGAKCTDCHARAGEKPKLLPEIPKVTLAGKSEPTVMNNQQAFHINCNECHDAVAKVKPASTGPGSKKCTACHKRAAA
jgi:cytochrome c553